MKGFKIFYGWWMVAVGSLVLGVYGGVYLYGFSAFLNPLQDLSSPDSCMIPRAATTLRSCLSP